MTFNPVPALIFRFDKCFKFGVSVDVVLYKNRVHVCRIIAIFLRTGSLCYEQNLTLVLDLMVRIHKCLDPGLRFSCNGLLVLHFFICDFHLYMYAYEYNYTPSPHSHFDECIFTTNV